jgi:hypothetical protein
MNEIIKFVKPKVLLLAIFSGVGVFGFAFSTKALTACEISCGALGGSIVSYSETCSSGAPTNSASINPTGISGYCTSRSSAKDTCSDIPANMCCTNGARHKMVIHKHFWTTSATCGPDQECQCETTLAHSGTCSGNPIAECKLIGTSCNTASDCCDGAVCNSNHCGTLGTCLAETKSCSCNAQCCSGVCSGGQCTGDGVSPPPGGGGGGCFPYGHLCSNDSECCFNNCYASGFCGVTLPPVVEICGDGIDNNSNGLIDCNDSACPPCCQLDGLVCPTTCTLGTNFTVNYLTKINSPFNPNLGAPNYLKQIGRWLLTDNWNWGTKCPDEVTVINRNWYPATQTFSCSDLGNYPNNVVINCDTHGEPVGCPSGGSSPLYCTVTPVMPTAVGYFNIKGLVGIIRLRLISFTDALAVLKGIIKISKTAGDTNTAADLVETTDSNASPVRVMTPYGIKAWRK